MTWTFDDGGRADAGFRGSAGDCAVRAAAIALDLDYRQVYDELHELQRDWLARRRRPRAGRAGKASPRTGVMREVLDAYLRQHGWRWTPTMHVGAGTTVHLRADELPAGRIIARCSRHVVAVIDGAAHDTADPTRDGTRAVYGYWSR